MFLPQKDRPKTTDVSDGRLRFNFVNYPLNIKLILTTTLVAVVAVIVITLLISRFTRNSLTEEAGNKIVTLANAQAFGMGEFLARELHNLETLAINQYLQDGIVARNAVYAGDRDTILAQLREWDEQWVAANDDDPLLTAVLNHELTAELLEFRAIFPENTIVLVTDRYGGLVAATSRTPHYYQADEEWWQEAYGNGFGWTHIGNPEFDESSGTLAINLALPLFNRSASGPDRIIGVLRTTIQLNALSDILAAASFDTTGRADLYLPNNVQVSRDENGQISVQELTPEKIALLNELQASEQGFISGLYEGVPSFISQTPVNTLSHEPFIDTLGWTLVIHQDQSEVLAPVQSQQRFQSILGVIVVLAAATIAAFVGKRLTEPITRLTNVALQVGGGDLQARAVVETKDEIGTLATTFNSMADQLEDQVHTLEQRVAARTKAIATSSEVSRHLSTILDKQELVTTVVEQIQTAFNYYHAHIYLLGETRENLVMVGSAGEAGTKMLLMGHTIAIGQGLVGRAALSQTAILVPDVSQEPGWLAHPLLSEAKAEVAVPIMQGTQVLGVLDVQHNLVDGLTQDDVNLLQSIARQVAIALQNADLLSQQQAALIAIREEQMRSQAILNTVTVPMIIFREADGSILYTNQPCADLFRLPQIDSIYDSTVANAYIQPNLAARDALMSIVQEQGIVDNYEVLLQRGDGDSFWALVSSRFFYYQGESAILTTLLDIQDRKQTEVLLAKKANELAAVAEVSTAAAATLDSTKMLQEAADLTKSRFDLYHAHIFVLDENKETLVLAAGADEVGRLMVAEGRRIALAAKGSLVATTARTKQGNIRTYESGSEGFMPHPLLAETRAELAVPMMMGDEVVGVLDVRSTGLTGFNKDDIQVFSTLANQIAIALQNARSFARSEAVRHELDAVTRRLTREGWERYMDTLATRQQFSYGRKAFVGQDDRLQKGEETPLKRPLLVQGEPIGEIVLDKPPQLNEVETVDIVDAVVDQLSQHIENLRLTEQSEQASEEARAALAQTQRQARRMALLAQISEKITVAGSLDEIYEIAASQAIQLFPSDRVTLSLLDETGEKAQVIALGGERGSVPLGVPQPIAGTMTEKAVRSRKAVVIHDPSPDPERGINSSMIVPLIGGSNVLGTINIGSKQLNLYDAQDENLTFQMASLLSAAIENQSLYAEQAATVQRLQELDELKSSFLANMSHELRTPLNSVIGFTDVMLEGIDGPLTSAMETDLKIIQSNGNHLLSLINDILDMAKIEAGRMELALGQLNIYDLLEEIVATAMPLAREKNLLLDLRSEVPLSALDIEGDTRRLKQVLLNLVSNAIKFTAEGSVIIEADRYDDLIQIRVKDTGAGIAPNQLEKIFEAFRQADNTATRKAGGTGLGLPISRRLVELHGGRLWVESVVDVGSTFFIELPVEVKRSVTVREFYGALA